MMTDMTSATSLPARPRAIPMIEAGAIVLYPLDGDAGRLADAIGIDTALLVLSRFGGSHVDLTGDVASGPLADLIGTRDARAVHASFGPVRLDPSLDRFRGSRGRQCRGLWLLSQGRSRRDVALTCDVTSRTVGNWRQALGRLPAHSLAQTHQEEPR